MLAIRSATEYYLPSIEDFETAQNLTIFHSYVLHFAGINLWWSGWFYIRPFKNFSAEKLINKVYIFIMTIIHIPIFYGFYNRVFFKLHPEQLDGYWKFYSDYSHPWTVPFYSVLMLFSSMTLSLFIIDFFRGKEKRIDKIILILISSIFPLLIYNGIMTSSPSIKSYSIPNVTIFYCLNTLIANWFFTNYRLFKDTSKDIIGDTFNSISDMVLFTGIDLKVKQWNERARSAFKINGDKPIFYKLLSSKTRMTDNESEIFVNTLLQNIGQEYEKEFIMEEEHKIFMFKVTEYLKNDHLFGYTFFVKDITATRFQALQLERQHAELKKLNTVKDRLFAIISHDIKNPVLSFKGIAKKVNYLIQNDDFGTLKKLGNEIESNASNLNSLTDNLLNWALMQKNMVPYQPTTVFLLDILQEVNQLFQHLLDEKEITLLLHVDAEEQAIADTDSVRIILRNVINNSIKFTPPNGCITVTTFLDHQYIQLRITDNGVGMSPSQIQNIFELANDKTNRGTADEKGTGIGLHLVDSLIQNNKGKIEVSSSLNKGTTFDIYLPISPSPTSQAISNKKLNKNFNRVKSTPL